MKYFIYVILLVTVLLKYDLGYTQNVIAEYDVSQDVSVVLPDKNTKEIGPVNSTGCFYKKNERYIYFERPDYLMDYPDGRITYTQDGRDDWQGSHYLVLDSIFRLFYVSIDSGIRRHRMDVTGKSGSIEFNYFQNFDLNFFKWNFYPAVKEINGLKCQKASWIVGEKTIYEVWYCPEIPTKAGLYGIINLPGLVVEAYNVSLRTTYKLRKYELNTPIDDAVFWPAEFNQPFKSMKNLGTPASNAKDKKRAELMKQ